MKRFQILFSFLLLLSLTLVISCKSNKTVSPTVTAMTMETVSLGSNGDGTITVRAWGNGANKAEAVEQAKRNALRDLIFKGISKGTNPGSAALPLVSEVNAEERYAEYFEPFFTAGGEYSNFVREEQSNAPRVQSVGTARQAYGVVLIIDVHSLRKQLQADGVLQ